MAICTPRTVLSNTVAATQTDANNDILCPGGVARLVRENEMAKKKKAHSFCLLEKL
jgi:hypothetical protein